MKKILLLSLVVIGLVVPMDRSSAQFTGYIGSPGSSPANPIYVQPDPQELYNYYADLYGSDFTSCHRQCAARGADTPYSESSCITYALSCLQKIKAQEQSPVYQEAMRQLSTPAPTPNQACQADYGTYAKYAGYLNNQGGYMCACKDGYEMSNNICIRSLTPDQSCAQTFGSFSVYSGRLNDKGGYICDCKVGYVWNGDGAFCVIDKSAIVPVKTETPVLTHQKTEASFPVKLKQPVKIKEEVVKTKVTVGASASTTASSTINTATKIQAQPATPIELERENKSIIKRFTYWVKRIFRF